ncbi:MOSC domain-containing protein [Paenibacillus sinopodophylli]|uniref:MOSC domain-containing protein n=1 Tax=Paenibacillus sinopodophylli TaxID=1837342 RepID=UPI00110D0934|nr:MOSC domain-containing protein [Paenibacillus sinopodophylli]
MTQQTGSARLLSLNVGEPVAIAHGSKQIQSGIFKSPSSSAHRLSITGIQGDGQGDLINHGGPDKAVCVYFEQRYDYWNEQFDQSFAFGAFGENFTLSEWTEDDLCIGDIIHAGDIIVQVSQPRQPCYKLGLRHSLPELPVRVQQQGFTGFYFRVLQEGTIAAGTPFIIASRHQARITIAEANRVMYKNKDDIEGIRKLLAVKELAASWQDQLGARLEKLLQDKQGDGKQHEQH